MMGHRRKSREYALQGLYIYEIGNSSLQEILDLYWIEKEIPEDIRDFSIKLIKGSIENIETIDALIKKHSKNWKFERIGVVDKSILRLSIFAILNLMDIPVVVTINEGIELGKIYGGETSSQFINGILDAVKKSERPGK
ncbi:MAG: transcription antitermination factor NusB [bacterium]|nr:transcription antitermination factor NusB [bacterium]